jgi:hypothetical protein
MPGYIVGEIVAMSYEEPKPFLWSFRGRGEDIFTPKGEVQSVT